MKRLLALSAACLVLAGICAALQSRERTTVRSGSEVRFLTSNSIQWTPETATLARTGPDPYGYLDLGAAQHPLRELLIEFNGEPPNEADFHFYVYRYPAYLEGEYVNDTYVLLGKIERMEGGYRIRWRLDESKLARLDLPDDLDRPIQIRRVTTVASVFGVWPGILGWALLAAAGIIPLWGVLRGLVRRWFLLEVVLLVTLAVVKLWIATDLRMIAIGSAVHDDALFVSQADAISRGEWLGPYNERTLTKGPVYALFLAGVEKSGIRLHLAQTGLHALACFLFVLALRPLVPAAGARLVLFTVLLFDPQTLSSEAVARVLRSGIQPALTLFALAGAIGIAARIRARPARVMGWSILAGVAWPTFWYSREEGIWLVPSVVLIGAVAAGLAVRGDGRERGLKLGCLALPLALSWGAGAILRSVNAHHYGARIAVDVRDGAFPAAYGALVRIRGGEVPPTVPVSREAQRRAFAASPAFAELRPFLEGEVGASWAAIGQPAGSNGVGTAEIHGGWYQWALRDAAARAGHYRDAATADAYWGRVAREINAACARGDLPADAPRSGLAPRWQPALREPLLQAWRKSWTVAARYADFTTAITLAPNTPGQLALFARVTHETPVTTWIPPNPRTRIRIGLGNLYTWCTFPATVLAVVATVIVAGLAWKRRRLLELAILAALIGGATALTLIIALVDVTSFSAVHAMYLAPATPIILAVLVLAPVWAFTRYGTDSERGALKGSIPSE